MGATAQEASASAVSRCTAAAEAFRRPTPRSLLPPRPHPSDVEPAAAPPPPRAAMGYPPGCLWCGAGPRLGDRGGGDLRTKPRARVRTGDAAASRTDRRARARSAPVRIAASVLDVLHARASALFPERALLPTLGVLSLAAAARGRVRTRASLSGAAYPDVRPVLWLPGGCCGSAIRVCTVRSSPSPVRRCSRRLSHTSGGARVHACMRACVIVYARACHRVIGCTFHGWPAFGERAMEWVRQRVGRRKGACGPARTGVPADQCGAVSDALRPWAPTSLDGLVDVAVAAALQHLAPV